MDPDAVENLIKRVESLRSDLIDIASGSTSASDDSATAITILRGDVNRTREDLESMTSQLTEIRSLLALQPENQLRVARLSDEVVDMNNELAEIRALTEARSKQLTNDIN